MTAIAIEQINPLDLPSLPLANKSELPEIAAVYFSVSEEGEILYVGQAVNLRNRWINHHRLQELVAHPHPVKVAWLEVQEQNQLNDLEKFAIAHFCPALNWKRAIKTQDEKQARLPDTQARALNLATKMLDHEIRLSKIEAELLWKENQHLKEQNLFLEIENRQLKTWRDSILAIANLAPND